MPVARGAPRLLSLVFVFSGVFFCYFVVDVAKRQKLEKRSQGGNREIVAFSLLKQIEIESEEIKCDGNFLTQDGPKKAQSGDDRWINVHGTNVFVYSVHRDRRLDPHEYVRIIAMVKGDWISTLFCQFLSSSGDHYITKATPSKIWSESWNQNDTHIYYNPFLISCQIPLGTTPAYLSLNTKPCQKGQSLFKIPTVLPPTKIQNFTICVKPLNFHIDLSPNLLQWIVINRILGASKIELYIETLPRKTLEVLEALQKNQDNVVLNGYHQIKSETPLDESTYIWQKRRYEIITYNDCLYRNIHTSYFVIPIDVDEIIVPRHVSTWAELLDEPLSKSVDNFSSYTVRNAYYLRRFNEKRKPKEKVFFFRNVIRSDFSGERESGKSFISTRNALTVFNHYALKTLRPEITRNKFLKTDVVQMNHYKETCDIGILPECAKYLSSQVRIVDGVVFKYKKVFFKEYEKLIQLLNRTLKFTDTEMQL